MISFNVINQKKILLFFYIISIQVGLKSQILKINDENNPESFFNLEELTRNILFSNSDCAEISNISSKTNGGTSAELMDKSYGYFERPDGSNFPFEYGIVLSTGSAASGGNSIIRTRLDTSFRTTGDNELELALNSTGTEDATYVEFDFVPLVSQISFNYLMASDEYEGFNNIGPFGCIFSDGFAFILEDLVTGEVSNLAVLPNGDPVNIRNINNEEECLSNPDFYLEINDFETNYNGRTIPLVAFAQVIPSRSYRIKLVVADQRDSSIDTTIFLEGGSFDLGLLLKDGNDEIYRDGEGFYCKNSEIIIKADISAPDLTFRWFKDGVLIDDENSSELRISNARRSDSGIYTVEANSAVCSSSIGDEVNISVENALNISSVNTLRSCKDIDGFAEFNLLDNSFANYNTSYFEDEDLAREGDQSFSIQNFSNYRVSENKEIWLRAELNGQSQCIFIVPFDLIPLESPTVNVTYNNLFCPNTFQDIQASGDFDQIIWRLNGQDLGNNLIQRITQPGIYEVEVTKNSTDCTFSQSFEIQNEPAPIISDVIIQGNTARVVAEGTQQPFIYELADDNGVIYTQNSALFLNLAIGNYNLRVQNNIGCFSEDYKLLIFNPPNFISPNGDGFNDVLLIEGGNSLRGSQIQIFDRYGKTILTQIIDSDFFEWNAQYLKRPIPNRTYWYIIDLIDGRKISGSFVIKK